MYRPTQLYIKRTIYAFLFVLAFIIYSFFNIFFLIITCNNYLCYYKKCNKHNFDHKMECFFDKTDDLIDWLFLDLFSLFTICLIISLFVFIKYIFYTVKNHCKIYIDKYYKSKMNQPIDTFPTNYEMNSFDKDITFHDVLELESLETDPLIMV